MRKISALMLALAMALFLSACRIDTGETETEADAVEEKTEEYGFLTLSKGVETKSFYTDDRTELYTYKYDYLISDEEEYPLLAKKLEEIARETEEELKHTYGESGESYVAEMVESARAHYERAKDSFYTYYDKKDDYVLRADENIVSILRIGQSYWGGAHPMSGSSGININPKTGEELSLDDVMKDKEGLGDLICEELVRKYEEDSFFPDLKENVEKEIEENSIQWTLSYKGITFRFSPYDIAPYYIGNLTAEVMFGEHPKMFDEKYTKAPECYAFEFEGTVEYDLDENDGKTDGLITYTGNGEYGNVTRIVFINNEMFEDDTFAHSSEVYLVHCYDENYIYVQTHADDGWATLNIYKIEGDKLTKVKIMKGLGLTNGAEGAVVFNNPDAFKLSTQSDLLSTVYVYGEYGVSKETGLPEAKTDYYTMNAYNKLTTKTDIEVKDENGKKKTLKKGSELEFYRTDTKTYVDMKTDGEIVRIEVDASSWPQKVNGKNIEDCFENTLFAG